MAIARAAVGGAVLSIRMASISTSFHCRTISAARSWRVSSDSNWAAMGLGQESKRRPMQRCCREEVTLRIKDVSKSKKRILCCCVSQSEKFRFVFPNCGLQGNVAEIVRKTLWSCVVSTLIRYLMLLTMLLHSVFGCTWHHFHMCHAARTSPTETLTQSKSHSCSCHHRHHSKRSVSEDSRPNGIPAEPVSAPCDPKSGCDHSVCSFIVSGINSELFQWDVELCIATEFIDVPASGACQRESTAPGWHSDGWCAAEFCAHLQVWQL
jgi:hypothetical protein